MAKIGFQSNRNTHLIWNLIKDEKVKEKLRGRLPKKWHAPDGSVSLSYDPFAEVEDLESIEKIIKEQPQYVKPSG